MEQKKKVKLVHSMMFKLVSLFVAGILLAAVFLMTISVEQTQKSTRSLVQSYMLSSAETNGYIMDTVLATKGADILGDGEALGQILRRKDRRYGQQLCVSCFRRWNDALSSDRREDRFSGRE